jgi:hypothetical protein
VGTDSKLPKIFDKPVTTDNHDYRFSRGFFAEKFFHAPESGVTYGKDLVLVMEGFGISDGSG